MQISLQFKNLNEENNKMIEESEKKFKDSLKNSQANFRRIDIKLKFLDDCRCVDYLADSQRIFINRQK